MFKRHQPVIYSAILAGASLAMSLGVIFPVHAYFVQEEVAETATETDVTPKKALEDTPAKALENIKQPAPFDFEHVSCRGVDQEIRVVVTRVKKSVGLIVVDLYSEDTEFFLRTKGRLKQVQFAAKSPETHFCLSAPETGMYSIGIYHDKNADNKLNKGAFGIPSEPYGISQNPKIRFSAPPIEKTLFLVPKTGANTKIKLRN